MRSIYFSSAAISCSLLFATATNLLAKDLSGWNLSGRVNTWGLYETNDVGSTTVALVYDTRTSPATLLGVAVGADIATECAAANRSCTYRTLGTASNESDLKELSLGR